MPETTEVSHQLTTHTKLLHKVGIVYEQKILVLRRSSQAQSRPNNWDLPGGNSEWPATITMPTADLHKLDISREILEETGLVVAPENFSLSSLVFFQTFFEPTTQIFTTICGWMYRFPKNVSSLAASGLPAVVLSSEHQDFRWVEITQLPDLDFGGRKGEFVHTIANQSLLRTA